MYLPATHCKQVPPSDPVYPLLQRQWVAAALPLGELESAGHAAQVPAEVADVVVRYVPAAQSVHVAVPVIILYFPPAHAVHAKPFAPVYPALHAHWVEAVLVTTELEFPGQAVQSSLPVLLL